MNPRVVIVKTVLSVFEDCRSLSQAFDKAALQQSNDWSFIKQCCFGLCRYYWQLDAIAEQLLKKPLRDKDLDIHFLLLLGIYQLLHLRIPSHAAVSETVNATKALKKPWASKFINACLRQFIRDKENLLANANQTEEGKYAHPQWLIDNIKAAWPDKWEAILNANNTQAPMTLRINEKQISREEYLNKHFPSHQATQPASSLQLQSAEPVVNIPGFKQGLVSVQDAASQCVAPLLSLKPGMKVLDACSAPGGKACHMLERCTDIELTALDIDEKRLVKVQENLDRLQLKATLLTGDASKPETWWEGELFDVISLDAPCSATGVIRRHPDGKWLHEEEDIEKLATLQQSILSALWPLLKPGGQLLYTTCSLFPKENSENIKQFLLEQADAKECAISLPFGEKTIHGWQVLPEVNAQDGFYYCLIQKLT